MKETAHRSGAVIYYPRSDEAGFTFRRAVSGELVRGRHGILEPPADAAPLDGSQPDIVIVVPALAYDRLGTRLGSGLGFYDRMLPAVLRARRVGVTLDALLLDRLPVQDIDIEEVPIEEIIRKIFARETR